MAATGSRSDPLLAFRFRVEIDVASAGGQREKIELGCTECGGLHAETETLEYREGGLNDTVHRFASVTRFPPIVLRRGLVGVGSFWAWYADAMAGRIRRANGAIWLLGTDGHEALRWDVFGAVPTKWTGPELRAETAALAFETVELAHRGFQMRSAS
jgi:phage tail-like protein